MQPTMKMVYSPTGLGLAITVPGLNRVSHASLQQAGITLSSLALLLIALVVIILILIFLLLLLLEINRRQRAEAEVKLINAELDRRVKLRTKELETTAEALKELMRMEQELTDTYERTLEGWSRMLELRGEETEGHTERVIEFTMRLASAMGLGEEELVHIRRGALLHDIGKIGIPDNILQKTDRLTKEEWEIIRLHPKYAYDLLSPIVYLKQATDIPYCHHERWDGTGYPQGLAGEQIPLAARIFSIVDVWDAMGSDRPYREKLPNEAIIAYILTQKGKQFDPEVVNHFMKLIHKEMLTTARLAGNERSAPVSKP